MLNQTSRKVPVVLTLLLAVTALGGCANHCKRTSPKDWSRLSLRDASGNERLSISRGNGGARVALKSGSGATLFEFDLSDAGFVLEGGDGTLGGRLEAE